MGTKSIATAAREFALGAHGPQRYGEQPYVVHLDEVATLVLPYGELHQAVAYLHDCVEDTSATVAEIEATFGATVARCVELLTDEPVGDRKERKRLSHARLARIDANTDEAIALVVKAADRLANVQNCVLGEDRGLLRRYRREHRDFRAAARRPGLADPLWKELDELIGL